MILTDAYYFIIEILTYHQELNYVQQFKQIYPNKVNGLPY